MTLQSQPLSPYEAARDRAGEIKLELQEIDDNYLVRKPILEKELIGLQAFIQSVAEVQDFRSSADKEALARIEKRKKDRDNMFRRFERDNQIYSEDAPIVTNGHAPERTPIISQPRTLGEVLRTSHTTNYYKKKFEVTEDVVLAIAAYIERHGPCKASQIYSALLADKVFPPIVSVTPVKAFSLNIRGNIHTKEWLVYDRDTQLWGLRVERAPQKAIKQELERAKTNGEAVASQNIPAHPENLPKAENSLPQDRSLHPFAMAVQVVFREQDNLPMGARQLWEEIEEMKEFNVTGCQTYAEFCSKIESYKDFFAFDHTSGTYYPLIELRPDPIKLIKQTGEMVAI